MLSAFCLLSLHFHLFGISRDFDLAKKCPAKKLWAGEVFICIRNLRSFLEVLSFSSPEDQSVIGDS